MIGILLMIIGSAFGEVSSSISKFNAEKRLITTIDIGIISTIAAIVPFGIAALYSPALFVLSPEAYPTMVLRIGIDFVLLLITLKALVEADRSTFSFIRTLTIPLLLVADLILGYNLTFLQLLGAGIIFFALMMNSMYGFTAKGSSLVFLSAVLAGVTISLYKYNLQFNSIVAEQLIAGGATLVFLIFMKYVHKESSVLVSLLKHKQVRLGFAASMLGHVLESLAFKYVVGTALVIAAKRAIAVFFSIVTGQAVFHEGHLFARGMMALLLIIGIAIMAVPTALAQDVIAAVVSFTY